MNTRRILVTGGSGYLGSQVVAALALRNHGLEGLLLEGIVGASAGCPRIFRGPFKEGAPGWGGGGWEGLVASEEGWDGSSGAEGEVVEEGLVGGVAFGCAVVEGGWLAGVGCIPNQHGFSP